MTRDHETVHWKYFTPMGDRRCMGLDKSMYAPEMVCMVG
jgi:hypothetical protein